MQAEMELKEEEVAQQQHHIQELEEMQQRLQEALQLEVKAQRDEEAVCLAQTRLLEEEEEKLKQLLQLKEEQERYLQRAGKAGEARAEACIWPHTSLSFFGSNLYPFAVINHNYHYNSFYGSHDPVFLVNHGT
ncbi:differentially expressed in FDCP 6 homolog [Equus przewalskii]|uniref:Differentially expressed in FDCP 6 homolog n=1 Tax=Equus przewalskii TaxID=9798 RepID=A0ABM4MJ00_EQUPR